MIYMESISNSISLLQVAIGVSASAKNWVAIGIGLNFGIGKSLLYKTYGAQEQTTKSHYINPLG